MCGQQELYKIPIFNQNEDSYYLPLEMISQCLRADNHKWITDIYIGNVGDPNHLKGLTKNGYLDWSNDGYYCGLKLLEFTTHPDDDSIYATVELSLDYHIKFEMDIESSTREYILVYYPGCYVDTLPYVYMYPEGYITFKDIRPTIETSYDEYRELIGEYTQGNVTTTGYVTVLTYDTFIELQHSHTEGSTSEYYTFHKVTINLPLDNVQSYQYSRFDTFIGVDYITLNLGSDHEGFSAEFTINTTIKDGGEVEMRIDSDPRFFYKKGGYTDIHVQVDYYVYRSTHYFN